MEEGIEEDDNGYVSPGNSPIYANDGILSVRSSQPMISACDELRSALASAVEKQAAQRDMKRVNFLCVRLFVFELWDITEEDDPIRAGGGDSS